MADPNCCLMIIAGTFFFSSQSPRGTVIYNQFGIIQVLQRSPILQTSNWPGTFFAVSYSKPALAPVVSFGELVYGPYNPLFLPEPVRAKKQLRPYCTMYILCAGLRQRVMDVLNFALFTHTCCCFFSIKLSINLEIIIHIYVLMSEPNKICYNC